MSDFQNATVVVGVPGPSGGGVTTGELTTAIAGLAPSDATYITQTSDGTLTGEQALDALGGPGIAKVNADGSISLAAGSDLPAHNHTGITIGLPLVINDGGTVISSGVKLSGIEVPFAATITGWTIVSLISGSIVCTVSKATYAAQPTYTAISGTEKPTLSGATKNQDLALTTWTTALAAGDLLQISVDATATSVTSVTVNLRMTRTV